MSAGEREEFRRWADDQDRRGLVLVGPDGRIASWNAGAERLTGYAASEAIGRLWTGLTHLPEGDAEERGSLIRKDGSAIVVQVAARRLPEAHVGVIVRDVDPPPVAEERFRALVDHAADPLFTFQDGVVIDVNRAACESLGYSREELIGMVPLQFDPDVTPEFLAGMAQRLRAGETVALESRHRRKDGTMFPVEVHTRIFPSDGVTLGLAVVRDITERKRFEAALRESEERFELALRGANDGIWDWNLVTDDVVFSGRWKSMLGYAESELPDNVGTWRILLHADDVAAAEERVRQYLASEIDKFEIEFRMAHKDGGYRTILSRGYLVWDDGRRPIRFVGTHVDITERKEAELALRESEAQLHQAQKMEAIGQLAGGIAHDFNNLLTVINCSADFLLAEMPPGSLQEDVTEIRAAGARAADLTQQLLAFSRKQILQRRVIDLNEVVSRAEKMLRRLIGEDITIVTALDSTLAQFHADPGQVEQVILNLVVNARDAMPTGGTVTIRTRNTTIDASPYVELSVADTGVGVADEVKAKLFEPFFSTKGQGKGTGLGLATVYGIVKQSGGDISLSSRLGEGTTLTLVFPATAPTPASTSFRVAAPVALDGNETILLVEDEDAVRRIARVTLEKHGYRVLEASNGAEAIAQARGHSGTIHLLLTDVVMPGTSGRVVADTLRGEMRGLRVLFMSGYTDDAVVRHGVLEATDDLLAKPFTPHSLVEIVRRVLDRGAR